MTEVTVNNELFYIMHDRDSGRNIADKAGRRSDVLNRTVPHRGVMTVMDKRGTAGARIGHPILDGEEDDGVRRRNLAGV
jgi:hypothetical protein